MEPKCFQNQAEICKNNKKKVELQKFRNFRRFEAEISKFRSFVRRFRSLDLDISTISVVRRRNFKVSVVRSSISVLLTNFYISSVEDGSSKSKSAVRSRHFEISVVR